MLREEVGDVLDLGLDSDTDYEFDKKESKFKCKNYENFKYKHNKNYIPREKIKYVIRQIIFIIYFLCLIPHFPKKISAYQQQLKKQLVQDKLNFVIYFFSLILLDT